MGGLSASPHSPVRESPSTALPQLPAATPQKSTRQAVADTRDWEPEALVGPALQGKEVTGGSCVLAG